MSKRTSYAGQSTADFNFPTFIFILEVHKPIPMQRLTLSFPSVFDLYDFKNATTLSHTEARVNLLTGHFTDSQIEMAIKTFKAEIIKAKNDEPLLNGNLYNPFDS